MVSRMLLFLCIVLTLMSQSNAQPNFLSNVCVDSSGNYTANSTYQSNLNTLLSSISSNTKIDYGFYNFSYGQGSDRVNAIGLCRGDVITKDCLSCLNDSRILLPKLCPNRKEAIGWYDKCMLRYSDRSIFNTMENDISFNLHNTGNATDINQFNQVLRDLLDGLISKAASGDSERKFAAASVEGPGFQTIYGLVQCTPDLSQQDCNGCLVWAISGIPGCCDNKKGGRILYPSCNFRYEIYSFFNTTNIATPPPSPLPVLSPPPLSTNAPSTQGKSNTSQTVIIAVAVPVIALVILAILICIYLRKRTPQRHVEVEAENNDEIRPTETFQLDFATIVAATDNFSESNKLGQGGFGPVYKGKLPNGQQVAVKRLSRNSFQGDLEFKNEVSLLAKLQHRNLVRLLGFCLERKERLLVYEFVPNKSLDFFIFDRLKRALLDWERRNKIIGGIVRGLLYLHEDSHLRIIHRDLKASNILLDAEMNPKISDFGMAKLFEVDQTHGNTSRIVGTYGYMAPEYAIHGKFSIKSDVFSLGVLILEIVSGQKNNSAGQGNNAEDLVSFAWKSWREGRASNIIDPVISDSSSSEIMRCIHIGLLCVQENVADRPTMASIVLMLNSHSVTLPLPSQPAFLNNNRRLSNIHSEEYNSETRSLRESSSTSNHQHVETSMNEASITEPFPR